ncbi:hypothetical protein HELRODRAFT_174247 [Helobdella robusta]|uniref:Endonuclease/exonuclease/phosphatase domain-containing protein n=1 Tax=Helobdella robusta TaxID=6412 RepID=T1F7V6_HELRO|nr:hypothetical protein HELRODRAFT_174247 [Helobdella robusta]ESO02823.1 hypothetical protein HELRODRAFT_174247 [Helobdella robusta]
MYSGTNHPGRQRGGGVVISLKLSISSQIHIVLPHSINNALETLCLKCTIDSEPYFICAIYHPPNHPSYEVSTLMGYIDKLSNTALGSESKLIIGGDFKQLDHHYILQTGLHPIFWGPSHQGHNLDRIYGINESVEAVKSCRRLNDIAEDIRKIQESNNLINAQIKDIMVIEGRTTNCDLDGKMSLLQDNSEGNDQNLNDNKRQDDGRIVRILQTTIDDKVDKSSIIKHYRLGKRSDKIRPLLVQLKSKVLKNLVMENLSNLKKLDEDLKRISVSHDLTREQRAECKKADRNCERERSC